MERKGTPENSKGNAQSFEKLCSPSSKKRLAFDLWNAEEYLDDTSSASPNKLHKATDGANQEATKNLTPIGSLSAGFIRQQIKFRVTNCSILGQNKDTIRFYGYDGTGEIAIYAFNNLFAKYQHVQANMCFALKNFRVETENPKMPSYSGHEFRIVLNHYSEMNEIMDQMPPIPFSPISIGNVRDAEHGSKIDIVAVAGFNWGRDDNDRVLVLTQGEGANLKMTLHDDEAIKFVESNIVVAVRKANVIRNGGEAELDCRRYTFVWKNPEIAEANEMKLVQANLEKVRQLALAKKNQESQDFHQDSEESSI